MLNFLSSFIFRALGQLVDYCLIAYASKYVKGVNAAGVRKIKRDILSLQQTLQGIAASSDQGVLSRAAGFWDLYEQGPKVSRIASDKESLWLMRLHHRKCWRI